MKTPDNLSPIARSGWQRCYVDIQPTLRALVEAARDVYSGESALANSGHEAMELLAAAYHDAEKWLEETK